MSADIPSTVPRERQTISVSAEMRDSLRAWATEGTALTAAASVRDPRGRIALVQNRWSDGWILPGGAVEHDETPAEAARREVTEETGLSATIDAPRVVLDQQYVEGETGTECFSAQYVVYGASADGQIPEASNLGRDDDEISAAAWFEQVPERLHDGDILGPYL